MKEPVDSIKELTFTLTSVSQAKILAKGEVRTGGWTEGELVRRGIGDGILHFDFVATPPEKPSTDAFEEIEADYSQMLAGQPQEITVHAATNEMSIRLPEVGDPP